MLGTMVDAYRIWPMIVLGVILGSALGLVFYAGRESDFLLLLVAGAAIEITAFLIGVTARGGDG